jgi:hypothetical protein
MFALGFLTAVVVIIGGVALSIRRWFAKTMKEDFRRINWS